MRVVLVIWVLAVASLGLLAREAAPDVWALPAGVHVALGIALLATGAAALVRGRRAGARAAGACLVLLAAAAAVRVGPVKPDPERWRAGEESRLEARFERVRARIRDTDAQARALGAAARRALAEMPEALAEAPAADSTRLAGAQARLFEVLDDSMRPAAGGAAAELGDTGAGIQLFDRRGALLSWAGVPHLLGTEDRLTRMGRASRATYFRRSGVHTLLSCEVRDVAETGSPPGPDAAEDPDSLRVTRPGPLRVLVDIPVAVRYRISNRFLRSHSLADEMSGGGVETEFVFDSQSLPPYLAQNEFEIQGDEFNGLQLVGALRDSEGAALALCRLAGLPFGDAVDRVAAQRDHVVRWLVLAAFLAGAIAAGRALRFRGMRAALALVVAVIAARWLAAFLGLPSSRLGSSLLNPASFAMVGFGGVLRSPLDLLLTASTVAIAAVVLFVHRARAVGSALAPPTGAAPQLVAGLRTAASVALAFGSVWAVAAFVGRVAGDSNPYLLGAQLDLLSPAVACLHLALWLGVAGWLVLTMLAADAVRGEPRSRVAMVVAVVALGTALWLRSGPVVAIAALLAYAGAVRLRSLLRDDRFTSFGLATFALTALAAVLIGDAVQREYFRANQARVLETAASIVDPADDLRRFVLEEVLQNAPSDADLRRVLAADRSTERGALAFEIWAQSMLSHLGFACEVRVYDPYGQGVSEFSVDMPTGHQASHRDLLDQARGRTEPVTRTESEASAGGSTEYYGGAVIVRAEGERGEELGAVVVELPFAQSSLDVAANPRARTPELLRNFQQEGIGPRIDESERFLLAWIDDGAVLESSTPYLEVGQPLRAALPRPGQWERLRLVNGNYFVTSTAGEAQRLLAGFRLPTALDRILQWTQVGSVQFAATTLVLLLLGAILRTRALARRLPQLLIPKRLGFQQKLMVAFLVVSLLPSVVLSLATRDIMRDRSSSRNRDTALARARAAEAALADLVRRDLDAVRESEYVRAVLGAVDIPPARELPEFGKIMLFRGDGRLVLDETLSDLSDEEARRFVQQAPRRVFAARDGRFLCLGALERIWFSPSEGLIDTAPDAEPYYVYYQRRLTDDLLRNLAPILATDLSAFLGPHLAVSSQRSLATAGLLPSLMPPQAFTHVQLRHNRSAVFEERAGEQRYFAGYVPLEDGAGRRIGALAASQLLQADEFAVEVERTRELVLGLSTLMFVLTLILGVAFATRIFDPVRSLIEGTRRIAGGDLGFRLKSRSSDEIGELERSFNDMSERLQAARWALDERRRYLEAVLGHIASGVVATDGDGRITAANPAAYRILGLPAGALEGRTWDELAAPGARRPFAAFWSRLREAPGGEVIEIPVHTGEPGPGPAPAGTLERLTLRVIVTDLLPGDGAGGARLGRVAIFEDVSDLIRSKKLSAWAEMARQVAHEIKNPLTPMKLSAQFMDQAFRDRSDKFPDVFRDGMKTIIEQVESLRRIASEFSNFGRIQKIEPRRLELAALLHSVTAPYRGIDGLQLEVPAEIDGNGTCVLGDDEGLRKVFRNVLENAREAMGGRGRITIQVERPNAELVVVRVADSGPGVSTDAAGRLFEPYFSTKTSGTGLGLAISKGIVEELGGSIVLSNRPGGGAEACITLVVC